ncbi:GMC oxidoreductase [Russula ochroleuca]|uniref:GMC oxidoreductase n=1 Tax=Russula ochroleuca TaxID=152965 RepID=A0A9P5TCT6_9AGAM|nr:GMC oxidoreductase [Russula ochroleuca]
MAERFLRSVHDAVSREYDYIIVGGGTAGLVVATRLSEDPTVSVLVLEAGRANLNDDSITMPGTFGKNFFQPDYEWGFMTVPQKHSSDTAFYWPRGKGLGGSSCINFYVFAQPPASDIDAIEKLGNPGWNWETYMRYSRKSERFTPPSAQEAAAERLHFNPAHHGTDGPISSCYAPLRAGWDYLYQDTLGNLGLPPTKDSVLGDGNGAWMATCSVNPDTKRRSTSVEYLHQASARENLHVVVSSPVTRVLFKDEKSAAGDVVASGVEFVHEGKTYTARANREVILSSGTLKSPQILEFSGIGNPEVLAEIGVKPKFDLPGVGENVQEHIFTNLAFELKNPEKYNTQEPMADEAVLKEQLGLYNSGNKSLFLLSFLGLGSGSVDRLSPQGAALISSHVARIRATSADTWKPGVAEQYALQVDKLNAGTASTAIVSMPIYTSRPNVPEPGKKYISIVAMLNHPWSRGTVHAVTPDPLAPPALDPHYYQDDFDMQTMIELTKFVRRLGKTAPLGDIIAREHNPGPEVQTDEELIAWIKQYTNSIAHTSGTCSMLPRDKGGVVDPRLKVYGTHNLRVVDLSILPLHIGAPTQVYVYGMAEQASDIIKGVI